MGVQGGEAVTRPVDSGGSETEEPWWKLSGVVEGKPPSPVAWFMMLDTYSYDQRKYDS